MKVGCNNSIHNNSAPYLTKKYDLVGATPGAASSSAHVETDADEPDEQQLHDEQHLEEHDEQHLETFSGDHLSRLLLERGMTGTDIATLFREVGLHIPPHIAESSKAVAEVVAPLPTSSNRRTSKRRSSAASSRPKRTQLQMHLAANKEAGFEVDSD